MKSAFFGCLLAGAAFSLAMLFWPTARTGPSSAPNPNGDGKSYLAQRYSIKAADAELQANVAGLAARPYINAVAEGSTYRPHNSRSIRPIGGALDKNGDVDRRVPGWWLYAKSEAEAKWLDHYGFPTNAEEAMLRKISDNELAALALAGDANARVHQGARLAKAALSDGNPSKAAEAAALLGRSIELGGGPYQAFIAYQAYTEMLEGYHYQADAQKTPEQRDALRKLESTAQLAFAFGVTFGDDSIKALANSSMTRELAGLERSKDISGIQMASTIAAIARRRAELGLQPVAIIARPTDISGSGVFERY